MTDEALATAPDPAPAAAPAPAPAAAPAAAPGPAPVAASGHPPAAASERRRFDGRWLQRRRRQHLDEAAERLRDRLARDPDSIASSRASVLPAALSGLVLAAGGIVVGLLAWRTVAIGVWWGWVLAALGWGAVWELSPRPGRLRDGAVALEASAYPALHRLAHQLSESGGLTPPKAIAVDTSFSTTVVRVGWRGTQTLRIGLPLWTDQSSEERLGSLAQALAAARENRTVWSRLTAASNALLERLWQLLEPQPAEVGPGSRLVLQLRRLAATPVAALLDLLARVGAEDALRRQYLTAGAASRRGEDPFAHLATRAARGSTVLRARSDDATTPERLRLALLRKDWVQNGAAVPDLPTQQAAEAELATLRPRLRRKLVHDLNDARPHVSGTRPLAASGELRARPQSDRYGLGSLSGGGD